MVHYLILPRRKRLQLIVAVLALGVYAIVHGSGQPNAASGGAWAAVSDDSRSAPVKDAQSPPPLSQADRVEEPLVSEPSEPPPPDKLLGSKVLRNERYEVELDEGRVGQLTLLPRLQEAVEVWLGRYDVPLAGFVAVHPRTGRILALVGYENRKPSYGALLRPVGPAASIFKVVTAATLLERDRVKLTTRVCFHGGRASLSKANLIDNPRLDKYCESFSRALASSRNAIFGKLAYKHLTANHLASAVSRFGFNTVIPCDVPVLPSTADVPAERVERARFAAGFYHVQLSPLHGALIAAAIANRGVMMSPHMFHCVRREDSELLRTMPTPWRQVVAAPIAEKLKDAMVQTTTRGTAARFFRRRARAFRNIDVSAKTGSLSLEKDGRRLYFSWFVGLAPAQAPEIAVCAVVANPPRWRVKGAQVARYGLETYFRQPQK